MPWIQVDGENVAEITGEQALALKAIVEHWGTGLAGTLNPHILDIIDSQPNPDKVKKSYMLDVNVVLKFASLPIK
jgi:hypothetical protein